MKPSERNFARRMDLTSLQLFVAVCELGSIGRTAERELMALTNNWAVRRIEPAARDFSSLPVTARQLVDHLTARAAATDSAPVST